LNKSNTLNQSLKEKLKRRESSQNASLVHSASNRKLSDAVKKVVPVMTINIHSNDFNSFVFKVEEIEDWDKELGIEIETRTKLALQPSNQSLEELQLKLPKISNVSLDDLKDFMENEDDDDNSFLHDEVIDY
jgi:hypothetical protein